MKMRHASHSCSNLQSLLQPLQFPSFTPLLRFSQSSPTTNFHKPISLNPQSPPLHSLRKPPLSTAHSLPDDTASGSAAVNVVDIDPSLTVKKKAMEISPDLKGTSIFLLEVAWQLGYDHIDAVTAEDMALEVLKKIEKLTRVKKMLEEAARPF